MAYKRYIKRGKNIYGPYVYHSRKENGKVVSEYKGKGEKKKKLKLILGGIFILLLLLFLTYNFIKTPTTGFLTRDEESESDDLAFIRFVIELTKAEHLDNNRQFISDIYNGVKSLDDVWSEEIPNGDYVRVTFEEELTSESDITIYPRIVSGSPKIEVYETEGSEIIAEFTNIQSNEYNKVLLTNLQGTQDTFDLMVLDGSIEIEHIVDPEERIKPVAPDNVSSWPVVLGCTNHYDCVDEDTADGDASEIECDANIIYYDYFNTNASFSSATHAIKNVTVYAVACIDSSKSVDLMICLNVSGTSDCSAEQGTGGVLSVCPSWTTYSNFWDISPHTTLEWTVDEVNGMLIGVRGGIDCNPDIHVTQVYAIVGYEAVTPPDNPPTWQNNQSNSSGTYPEKGDAVLMAAQGSDDLGLWQAILSTNETGGTWVNYTADYGSPMELGNVTSWEWSNFTWSNTSLKYPDVVGWRIWYRDNKTISQYNVTDTLSFQIKDETEPQWQSLGTNDSDIINQGESVKLVAQGRDFQSLDWAILSTNETGSFINYSGTYDSPMGMSDAEDTWAWSNFTWDNNSFYGALGFQIWYNDTAGNYNVTNIYVVTVTQVVDNEPYYETSASYLGVNTTTPNPGDTVQYYSWWWDDNGLSLYTLEWNETESFVNQTWQSSSLNNTWHNYSIQVPSSAEGKFISARIWANDTENQFNVTGLINITVQNIAPTITLPVYNNATPYRNDQSMIFNISVSDTGVGPDDCTINVDTASESNITVDVVSGWCNGTYPLTGLGDGNKTINAYANDTLGNTALNDSYVVWIDTTEPTITLPVYNNATPYRNDSSMIFNISVSDTGVGPDDCTINVNTASAGNVTVPVNNGWCNGTYDLAGASDGNQTINAYANDTVGNWGLNDSYVVWIDTTEPTITLPVYINATKYKNTQSMIFNISVSDAGVGASYCSINVPGNANQTLAVDNGWCNGTYNLAGASDGNKTINAYANDTLGNTALNDSYVVWLDSTAPIITVVSPLNQNYTTTTVDFNVSLNENTDWCGFSLDETANVTMTKFNDTYFNYTNSSMTQGQHNVTFSCNDSLGNMNASAGLTYFTVDTTGPSMNNEGSNETAINQSEYFCLNITATDIISGVDTVYAEVWNTTHWLNYTMNDTGTSCGGGEDDVYGVEIHGTAVGLWNYSKVYANDTLNNWDDYDFSDLTINVTTPPDTVYPQFSNFQENPTNDSDYSFGQSYQFNSTITNTNGTIFLSFEGTNYSASNDTATNFYVDISSLAAETYNYYWWGYGNGSQNNYNSSSTRVYVVQKANPDASLENNESWTVTYPTTVKINYSESNDGDGGVVYKVWRDNVDKGNGETVLLGFGTYNYKLNTSGGTNYTANASIDEQTLTINKNTGACNVLFNESSGITYPSTFKVWTNCTSGFVLYRNSSAIGNNSEQALAASAYNFTVIRNDTINYSNIYDEEEFVVNKGTSEIATYIDNVRNNKSVLLNSEKWLNATLITPSSGNIELWYNNSLINQGSSPLSNFTNFTQEGEFNVTAFYDGNENWTNDYETWWVNVSEDSSPTVNIVYPENISYNSDVTQLNYTADDDISLSHCWYSLDGGATNSSPDPTCSNHTGLPSIEGSNNWTVYANDSIGQVGSDIVFFTKDTVKPNVQFVSLTTSIGNYSQNYIQANVTASDATTGLDTITIYLYNSTNLVNSSSDTTSPYFFNFTNLDDGTYYLNATANDTAGNENQTETRTILLDITNPQIQFTTGTENNDTTHSRDWVFANVTVTEDNFENITYVLYNSTSEVNTTVYTTEIYQINWTSLSDETYTYNVTICDISNQCNTTETRTITLDITYPTVSIVYPVNDTDYTVNVSQLNYTYTETNCDSVWWNNGTSNSTRQDCGTNWTGLTSNEGSNTWTVYINDTSGNENSSSVTFNKDTAYPQFSNFQEAPANNSDYSYGQSYQFNVTIINTNGTVWISFDGTNYTAENLTADEYNVTLPSLSVGTYNYNWSAYGNGTLNNFNISGTRAYVLNKAIPTGSLTTNDTWTITYPTTVQIGYSESNDGDGGVVYKVWRDNVDKGSGETVTLGFGTYDYVLNTTGGTNYTANASIDAETLTVNKNTGSCSVLFNESSGITYGTIFRVWTNCTSGFVLYRNSLAIDNNSEQSLGASSYNFTVIRNDTVNYSNYYDEREFIVDKATPTLTKKLNGADDNQSINYPIEVNASASTTGGTVNIYRNSTNVTDENNINVSLAVSYYEYEFNVTGNENYTDVSSVFLYATVNKGTSEVATYIDNVRNSKSVLLNSEKWLNATLITPGSGNIELWYNNSLINQGSSPLSNFTNFTQEGEFNVTSFYDGNENYTSDIETWWVTVSTDSAPTVNIVYPENISYNSDVTQLNYTVEDDIDLDTCWYSTNGGAINETINTCGDNVTGLNANEGSNNWTVYANDSIGQESSDIVFFTKDTIYPTFPNYLRNPDPPNEDEDIQVNVTITEDNLDEVILEWNGTTNYTVITSNGNQYYFTVLSGNYTAHDSVTYYWYANDTAGNMNKSAQQDFIVANQIPSLTVNEPDGNNDNTKTTFNVTWSASDNDAEDSLTISCYGDVDGSGYDKTYTCFTGTANDGSENCVVSSWDEDAYYIWCNATDGYGSNADYSPGELTIDKTGPSIGSETKDKTPNEDQDVQLNATVTESGVGLDTVWVNVSVNNSAETKFIVTSHDGDEYYFTLDKSNYTAHDIVNWTYHANDTLDNLGSGTMQSFTVANQIPTLSPVPSLNSTSPKTNDLIKCNNGTFQDDDGEDSPQNAEWKWYKDDTEISGEIAQTLDLSTAGNGNKGDVIKCSERVYDGYNWSNWYNSSNTASIDNTAPTIDNPQTPVNKDADGTPYNYDYDATDPDVTDGVDTLTWYDNTTLFDINSTTGVISDIPTEDEAGTYSIRINVSDGTVNDTDDFTYTINDVTSPQIQFVSPTEENASQLTRNYIQVNVTASDGKAIDTITVYLYNQTSLVNETTNPTSPYFVNFTNLPDEFYYFNATVNDTSDNTNQTETRTVSTDTGAPTINYVSPTETSGVYKSQNYVEVNVTASDPNLDKIVIRLYNSAHTQIDSTITSSSPNFANFTSLSDSLYYYNATANDTFGNADSLETRNITLDITKPSITSLIEFPTDPATYSQGATYQFNATITDTNLDIVLIEFDGTNYTPTQTGNIYNLTLNDLAAGNYNYYWYANDSAGNVNQTSDSYTIDNATGDITLLINDSASNQSGPYGTQTNASATTSYGSITLYRNETEITGENNVYVTLAADYYNYTAVSSGDQNHSSASITRFVDISKATSEVNLTLNVTDGNVTIDRYTSIYLNGTLVTGDSSATLKLYNNGTLINEGPSPKNNLTTFSEIGVFNITVFYIESQNYTGSYETWWVNVTEAPDQEAPSVSSLTERPEEPVNYSEGATYEFNATITDAGVGLDTVLLDFNGTNYTATNLTADVYNVTFTDLAVGTYDYRWYANDTSENVNNTENGTYIINQTTPSLDITFSPSDNENYGAETTANGTGCPSQLTCNLYRNDTGEVTPPDVVTLGVGAYNYTYNTTGNVNYTSASVSDILTINQDTSSCSVVFNESSPITYPNIFTVWTNCTSGFVLYRNGTTIENNSEQSLGVSSYNFTVIRNDTVNYSNYYDEETFIVQQATGVVYTYVNNSMSNITINQYSTIWLNGTLETGQAGENIKLYNNETLINHGPSPRSNLTQFNNIGLFNITTIYEGNENYTSAYETWWVNVLEIDITKPNISIVYPSNNTNTTNANINVNYTVSDNQAVDSCWYSNDTYSVNTSLGSGGSCTNITTVTWSEGQHNVIVWANDTSGNENSSSVTFFVDSISPTIEFVDPTKESDESIKENYIEINVTASDTNLDKIVIRLYNSTSLLETNISTSVFFINYTGLSAETYYYNATANDTFGNNISTETRNISLVLPELTIIKPENETYIHTDNLLLNYTADYEDYVWYNINQTGDNETITGNTTFNTTQGQHTFYLYANNTLGETARNVTFSVDTNKFTVIYNEFKDEGESTDFNQSSYEDLQNLSDVVLENTDYGKIEFSENINLTADANVSDNETDLDTYTNISSNHIELNSTALPNFNKNATLYFYNLSLSNPRVLRDEIVCPPEEGICTSPVYSSEAWSFNITGFTVYSLEETPVEEEPSEDGDGARPSGGVECTEDSQCTGDNVCWNYRCVKLFDVKIIDFDSPVQLGEFFEFTYFIKGIANINDDVEVRFWIEKDGEIVTSGSDTIYLGSFEEKTETTKIFLPTNTKSGIYQFYIEVYHQAYQAKSHRTIEIRVGKGIAEIIPIDLTNLKTYIILGLIILALFILFVIFYLERKKIKRSIEQGFAQETRLFKKHRISVLVFVLFIVLGTLAYSLNLFGFLARWLKTPSFNYFLKTILVLFGLLIIVFIINKTNFFQRFKSWRAKRKEINRLKRVRRREIEKLKREKIRRELRKVVKVRPKTKPLVERPRIQRRQFMKAFIGIITSLFRLIEEIAITFAKFSGKLFRAFKIFLRAIKRKTILLFRELKLPEKEIKVVKKVKKHKPTKKRKPGLRILFKLKKALSRFYEWSKKVDRSLLGILKKTHEKFEILELDLEEKISKGCGNIIKGLSKIFSFKKEKKEIQKGEKAIIKTSKESEKTLEKAFKQDIGKIKGFRITLPKINLRKIFALKKERQLIRKGEKKVSKAVKEASRHIEEIYNNVSKTLTQAFGEKSWENLIHDFKKAFSERKRDRKEYLEIIKNIEKLRIKIGKGETVAGKKLNKLRKRANIMIGDLSQNLKNAGLCDEIPKSEKSLKIGIKLLNFKSKIGKLKNNIKWFLRPRQKETHDVLNEFFQKAKSKEIFQDAPKKSRLVKKEGLYKEPTDIIEDMVEKEKKKKSNDAFKTKTGFRENKKDKRRRVF